jgi:hypothetical protein
LGASNDTNHRFLYFATTSQEEREDLVMRTTDHRSAWMMMTTFACLLLPLDRCQAETVEWIRQLGTGSHEDAIAVSADGLGNVYIAGETNGSLLGGSNAGGSDAFISKFDAAGNLVWKSPRQVPISRQIGTSAADHGYGVSADGLGNVYMSGSTEGSLGGPNAGGTDAFVTKWDPAGNLLWTRQLGTAGNDLSRGVSADGLGNVYISGYTGGSLDGVHTGNDAFVSKYDAAGTLVWTQQTAFSGFDESWGVSTDRLGNIYIAGDSTGAERGVIFVNKYDAAGTLVWTRQFGAEYNDECRGVSVDGLGNVYISGYTSDAALGGNRFGDSDAFISKLDAAGTLLWTRQLGTGLSDYSFGVSADGLGNAYIAGRTEGNLGGTLGGPDDAFISKFDAAGNLLWTKQLSTSAYEGSLAVSVDGLGNVYTAGGTEGSLGGPNVGFGDAFLVKIRDTIVPEPATGVLFALTSLLFSCRRRRVGSY